MRKLIPALILLSLLAACAAPQAEVPTATAEFAPQVTPNTNPISANTPEVLVPPTTATPQAELVRLSGTGPGESQPFTLAGETPIRVNFKTLSDERIQIKLVSTTPDQVDARFAVGSYATTLNPAEGFTDNTLPAGSYKVVVETLGGAWEVWVEILAP